MAFTPFATPDDLAAWISADSITGDPVALLRSATFLVALACQRNPFGDPPSGSDVEPLMAATCAQASAWVTLGIDPSALGLGTGSAPVKKSSILGADVERDTSKQAEAQLAAARELCPESIAILTAAGLIWQPVPLGASQFDRLPSWGQGVSWWESISPWRDPLSGEVEWAAGADWPLV